MTQLQDSNPDLSAPWQLSDYPELAFDGLTGSEYWTPVPCALNTKTGEKLTLPELIPILNALEKLMPDESHVQHIRQALYAVGIDWNQTTAKLAYCPWVTETYINAHAAAVEPKYLGLAIRRMLNGLQPPPSQDTVRQRLHKQALANYPQIRR